MKNEKISKKNILSIAIFALILVMLAAILLIALHKSEDDNEESETCATMDIVTMYATLKYPEEYRDYLVHREITDGMDATEVFSMIYDDVETELFRLSFTVAKPENIEGYFKTESETLYVSVQPFTGEFGWENRTQSMDDDVCADMESKYYAMMGEMGTVLTSLHKNDRYSIVKEISENDIQTETVLYWEISLPRDISWEVTTVGESKKIVFRGVVGEKEIALYAITLDPETNENTIGRYASVDGEKNINVQVYDLNTHEELSEEERTAAYMLMDTVNDVIRAIRDDEKFNSEPFTME